MSARRWWEGRVVLVGAASAVALTLTGCGGGPDSTSEVASVEDAEPGTRTDQGARSDLATYVGGKRIWVKCLRENGIDAPDPNAKGQVELGDAGKLKKDPEFTRVLEKCGHLNPAVPTSIEKSLNGRLSKDVIESKKKYAKCMQENGAPDFPDPDDDGYDKEVPWDSAAAGAKRGARVCGSIIGVPPDGTVTPKG